MGMFSEFIGELGSLVVESARELSDLRKEGRELFTDGFVETVIKGNTNYKTSFEKREEADSIISREQRRYRNASEQVNSQIAQLNAHIESNNVKKRRILSSLSQKTAATPTFGLVRTRAAWAPSCKTDYLLEICESLLGTTLTRQRKQYADDYLEEAKDYRVRISGEIAKLNAVSAKLLALEQLLQEEEALLDCLEQSLRTDRRMKYRSIADQLNVLVATYIADQTGAPNSTYQRSVSELKRLCAAL